MIPELVSWLLHQFLARSAQQHVVGNGRQLLQQVCIILPLLCFILGGLCLYVFVHALAHVAFPP